MAILSLSSNPLYYLAGIGKGRDFGYKRHFDFAHRRGATTPVMPSTETRHDHLTIANNNLTIGLNYLTISCGKTTG